MSSRCRGSRHRNPNGPKWVRAPVEGRRAAEQGAGGSAAGHLLTATLSLTQSMSSLKAIEKEMKKEHKATAKELDQAHKQLEAAIKDEQRALKVRRVRSPARRSTLTRSRELPRPVTPAECSCTDADTHPLFWRTGRGACACRAREGHQEGGQGRAQSPSTG